MILSLTIYLLLAASAAGQSCNIRATEAGSVCVCNAKYCDIVPSLEVTKGKYQIYTTTKARLGLESNTGSLSEEANDGENIISVNETQTYQKIIGFGGAFTDSTGINIKLLPEEAQRKLIESYFGSSGIEYSLCRVPMGGTDFSTRAYSYDDVVDDVTLEHFALQNDDIQYKIPFIQQANDLRGSQIQLFTSAWTAPAWMKTNNDWSGIGFLKQEYYQLWADYVLKFYEEYEKHNITFWGMTTQNEPANGFIPNFVTDFSSMAWLPSQMNEWIGQNLGPTIRNSKYKDLKIMLHDDNSLTLPLILPLVKNNITMNYADGAAYHRYTNFQIPITAVNLLKTDKKDWFFISSEACSGYLKLVGLEDAVSKGNWTRGENYIKDILDNLEQGASGWVDWNMVLDENGGPTYVNNFVDSPVLVNETLQEFYKQPMFYAMGHFSKFVVPGSVRIDSTVDESLEHVRAVAFLRPDNLKATIIFNGGNNKIKVRVEGSNSGGVSLEIEAKSLNTILYY